MLFAVFLCCWCCCAWSETSFAENTAQPKSDSCRKQLQQTKVHTILNAQVCFTLHHLLLCTTTAANQIDDGDFVFITPSSSAHVVRDVGWLSLLRLLDRFCFQSSAQRWSLFLNTTTAALDPIDAWYLRLVWVCDEQFEHYFLLLSFLLS